MQSQQQHMELHADAEFVATDRSGTHEDFNTVFASYALVALAATVAVGLLAWMLLLQRTANCSTTSPTSCAPQLRWYAAIWSSWIRRTQPTNNPISSSALNAAPLRQNSAMARDSAWLLCKQLRTITVPVIILTARSSVSDTVAGLESGADDYMAKPFRFEELLARIRLRLRERPGGAGGQSVRGFLPTVLRLPGED